MNHTKGPWSYYKTSVYVKLPYVWVATTNRELAGMPEDQEAEYANARLIAAAPELLEALKQAMGLAWRDHKTSEEQAFLEETDKLIERLSK